MIDFRMSEIVSNQCWPRLFYSQQRQLPCQRQPVLKPAHLPLPHSESIIQRCLWMLYLLQEFSVAEVMVLSYYTQVCWTSMLACIFPCMCPVSLSKPHTSLTASNNISWSSIYHVKKKKTSKGWLRLRASVRVQCRWLAICVCFL